MVMKKLKCFNINLFYAAKTQIWVHKGDEEIYSTFQPVVPETHERRQHPLHRLRPQG